MQLHVIISLLSPKSTLKGHGPRKLMNSESLPRSEVFNRDYFRSVFVKGASSSPLSKKKSSSLCFTSSSLLMLSFFYSYTHKKRICLCEVSMPIIPSNTLLLFSVLSWSEKYTSNQTTGAMHFFLSQVVLQKYHCRKTCKRGDCSERLSFSRNYGAEVSKACWRAYSSSIGRGRKHFRGSFAKLLFFFLTYFFPKIRFFFSHNCFPGIYQWEEHTWS